MDEGKQVASAVTVRLGMASGAVLGGFVGHWLRLLTTPGREEGLLTWPTVVGAVAGFAVSWAVLTWLARKHTRAGVTAGAVLTIAAVVAVLSRVVK
jgi:hypothetical protein